MLTKNKVIIVIKTKKGLTYLRAKCHAAITTWFVKEEEEEGSGEDKKASGTNTNHPIWVQGPVLCTVVLCGTRMRQASLLLPTLF